MTLRIPPTLTDGTVTLRVHRPSDAERIVEQSVDPDSVRWTTVPSPYGLDDARAFLGEVMPGGWVSDREWGFAVEFEGRYAGTVSLRNEGSHRAELAYGSHPDVRGSGVMERAVRLLLAWGFEELGLRTVVWWAPHGNWASRRLAWKVGFSLDGTVRRWLDHRGEPTDAWVGTLLREDPREPRTRWLANPRIAADGVVLRPLTEADVPRIVEGIGDADTQYWLSFLPRDPDEADARSYLEQVTERLATDHTVTWAFCTPGDERLAGVVGLYRFPEPEVGYWTHPDSRGRGLTARAAAAAVGHGFSALGLERITGNAAAPNLASRRVLERIGMRQIGIARRAARTGADETVDLASYDLLPTGPAAGT